MRNYNIPSREYVETICKICFAIKKRRKDSIKYWGGLCHSCRSKKTAQLPHIKEIMKQNGLDFIEKFGEIPNAHHFKKGELAGENHHNWGKFREKSPCWIADRSKLKVDDRRSLKNNCWVEDCKIRDGFKCKINNKDCTGQLEVHHILSWKEYPELRHDINNGITLCHFHHPRKRAEEKRLAPYFENLLSGVA